jgi:3',5'-nucleoside bisphosphate phosphatase
VAVDLHTHSLYSDGTDDPAELVRLALSTPLTALALTDHDTLDGIPVARAAANGTGLDFVPGVELSVDWEAGPAHFLAYWIEPGGGPLQDRLAEVAAGRARRNSEILAALAGLGFDLTPAELRSGPGLVGRPHIAAALVRRGHVPSMEAAFDLYLAHGRPAYRNRPRLTAADAVALARRSGGAAVLAHPHTVAASAGEFAAALEAFAALGGAGVECHYPDYPPDLQAHLAAITRRLGMAPTGGSDYHGEHRPGIALGRGRGDLEVPDESVAELRRSLPS